MSITKKKIFIGLTGASGIIYAKRLIQYLSQYKEEYGYEYDISIAATDNALLNANIEDNTLYISIEDFLKRNNLLVNRIYDINDLAADISSGSNKIDYTFIAPASMGYIARVAVGISSNLIERVTDVAFKERRKIAILFREMPLSTIYIDNIARLIDAGAIVMPAAPAFYHQPESINDLINFVIGKLLDSVEIDNTLYKRWK